MTVVDVDEDEVAKVLYHLRLQGSEWSHRHDMPAAYYQMLADRLDRAVPAAAERLNQIEKKGEVT